MTLPTEDEMRLLFQKSIDECVKLKGKSQECLILYQTLSGIMKKKDGSEPTFGMTKRPLDPKMIEMIWDDIKIKAEELKLI